ncbi:hypothetical protein CMO91_05905 [Candidatus Woesearchaeota archaeon]|jgi:hypothetical protein|nr:hypothetical protein [Candidatus Woesearchaeota archaeon]|tara:strand:- start:178 stop:516 length:339 start_codon:yes stop_codon:yes gene_type:complete
MPKHYNRLKRALLDEGLHGPYTVQAPIKTEFWEIERWRGRDSGIRFTIGTDKETIDSSNLRLAFYGKGGIEGNIDGVGPVSSAEPSCEEPIQEFVTRALEVIHQGDWQLRLE